MAMRDRRLQAALGDVEIMVYGDIGWTVTSAEMVTQIREAAGRRIVLGINSLGGDVFEAQAIYAALVRHGMNNVVARIDGIAASAASWIAMAAGEVVMAEGAWLMIHSPHASAWALNSDDLDRLKEQLDKIESSMISAYARKSGMGDDDVRTLLRAETWMTAEEAQEKGFCDRIEKDAETTQAKTRTSTPQGRLPALVAARVIYDMPPEAQADLARRNLAAAHTAAEPDGPPVQDGPNEAAISAIRLRRARLKLLNLPA